MIESFIETGKTSLIFVLLDKYLLYIVKAIFYELDQDADIAIKYGDMLKEYGFEVLDQQIKRVHYGNYSHFPNSGTNLLCSK